MYTKKETTSPWLIAFRVLFTVALVGTIVFIFRNSMQSAAISDARSLAMMDKVNSVLTRIGITDVTNHTIRKAAHFLEYCLEGFWLMLCLRVYTRRFVRHISWPLLGALLTALADETIQLMYTGRSSQLTDVWLDFSGSVTGLVLGLFILLFFHMCGAIRRYNRLVTDTERRVAEPQPRPEPESTWQARRETAMPAARQSVTAPSNAAQRAAMPAAAQQQRASMPNPAPQRAPMPREPQEASIEFPARPQRPARQAAALQRQPAPTPRVPAAPVQPPQIRIEFNEEN